MKDRMYRKVADGKNTDLFNKMDSVFLEKFGDVGDVHVSRFYSDDEHLTLAVDSDVWREYGADIKLLVSQMGYEYNTSGANGDLIMADFNKKRVSDSRKRRIKDNTEESELWVQHDVYKEPADDIDFDWDSVDEDELTPDQYIWGVNNQYRWEEPLYVDWNWSDEELVNYLIQIGFLNRGVTASDLNIDWDGASDMIILEQSSDGMPLGYITKAY